MAFFEQLGKKLSSAGQSVVQQTKNFTETTRLNSSVSEAEKKIESLYSALGKAYYDNHKDDASAEGRGVIEEITAAFAQIDEIKEQINQIKTANKCPNCGAEISAESAFCKNCGAKLNVENTEVQG